MADNLPPSSADITESGSLPEPAGPHTPVMGLFYLYLFTFVGAVSECGSPALSISCSWSVKSNVLAVYMRRRMKASAVLKDSLKKKGAW
jgi:hypothetical protein